MGIVTTPECARLQITLQKEHLWKLKTMKRPNGDYTATAEESLKLMLQAHCLGSATLDRATTDNREHLIPVVQPKRNLCDYN